MIRSKDLESAVGVLEFLFKDLKEKKRVGAILAELPPKWRKTILSVSSKHFPVLNEYYEAQERQTHRA
jgi:anti-anti-sigma regulatory factor